MCMISRRLSEQHGDIRLADLSLNYGQIRALKLVNLTLGQGEVHAVVGEHGAGKSSLAMILSGMQRPQNGIISVNKRDYRFLNAKIARQLGIETVYQQSSLNEYFTVAENLFFTEPSLNKWFGWRNKKRMISSSQALFTKYQIDLDPNAVVKRLSLSDQILVDLLKHLYPQPRLLILDEVLERLSSAPLAA